MIHDAQQVGRILDAMLAIARNDTTPEAKATAIETVKGYIEETEEIARAAREFVEAVTENCAEYQLKASKIGHRGEDAWCALKELVER